MINDQVAASFWPGSPCAQGEIPGCDCVRAQALEAATEGNLAFVMILQMRKILAVLCCGAQ
jgi:hypothetical protein